MGLLSPLLLAAGTAVTTLAAPPEARAWVLWTGAAATVLVAAVTALTTRRDGRFARQQAEAEARRAALEAEISDLREQVSGQNAAVNRLAHDLLPEAVRRIRRGEFAETVLTEATAEGLPPRFHEVFQTLLSHTLEIVQTAESRRDAGQRTFLDLAYRLQSLTNQQATVLRELQREHGELPDVVRGLMRVDHMNAQMGRLGDSISVLNGGQPGPQRTRPVPLYDALRGAASRIKGYNRLSLPDPSPFAVIGHASESVMHTLAELLDNATTYSPPGTLVRITMEQVANGIAVGIHDGGLGMNEETREQCEDILRRAHAGIGLEDLGETPQLGLAVVGTLAHRLNLQISVGSSPYGGVSMVVLIPKELITAAPSDYNRGYLRPATEAAGPAAPPAGGTARSGGTATATVPAARTEPSGHAPDGGAAERTANGLPQRRRKTFSAAAAAKAASASAPAGVGDSVPEYTDGEPGDWLAAFSRGLESAPSDGTGPSSPKNDDVSSKDGRDDD
ncbi:sensor histidine kinase KdpD [Streptomyces sp. YIM 98790]|uniref:sensor histidine kinase n=1 Tax=Streptomyces sp. YIM 98790 TaxID=2689077 RepID=UPI001408B2E9|nr:sensor histidine kinase [Streptomyces sp. YIM 98790]